MGLIVDDIINLNKNFQFCAFSFIRKEGSNVAHSIAHLQLYVSGSRVWLEDGPDCVFNLAFDDLCNCLNFDE